MDMMITLALEPAFVFVLERLPSYLPILLCCVGDDAGLPQHTMGLRLPRPCAGDDVVAGLQGWNGG